MSNWITIEDFAKKHGVPYGEVHKTVRWWWGKNTDVRNHIYWPNLKNDAEIHIDDMIIEDLKNHFGIKEVSERKSIITVEDFAKENEISSLYVYYKLKTDRYLKLHESIQETKNEKGELTYSITEAGIELMQGHLNNEGFKNEYELFKQLELKFGSTLLYVNIAHALPVIKGLLEENQLLALENQKLRNIVRIQKEHGHDEIKDAKKISLDTAINNAASRAGSSGEENSKPRKKEEYSL